MPATAVPTRATDRRTLPAVEVTVESWSDTGASGRAMFSDASMGWDHALFERSMPAIVAVKITDGAGVVLAEGSDADGWDRFDELAPEPLEGGF